jgi:hypothetical protein
LTDIRVRAIVCISPTTVVTLLLLLLFCDAATIGARRGDSEGGCAEARRKAGSPSVYGAVMGRLRYDGTSDPIHIEDETLAHLKIVISTKLRRQESFMMTWTPILDGPDKRATVWIHPAIPLQFGFDSSEIPVVDPARIQALMQTLNASGELLLDHLMPPR